MDTEDRKIPYKKLIGIITSITSFFKSEDLTTTLINIMMHFMDIDIIDIKLAGIKICITVYTTVLPTETILEEYYQGTFAYVIGQASSNIESLVLLKPVLIKFAENNALVGDILDCLWNGINSLAPSVIQRGFDLFAEIALKVKTVDNHLIELILNPPNIDILCRLVNGPNFSQLAINELSTLAEKESSIEALDALIKVSLKTNLVNMIPEILSNINNKQLLLKNIVLINRIIIKTPTIIDTKEIVSSLSHNFSMYSIKEVEEVMESLSSILMRTRTKVTNDDFSILIKNCTNNESLTIVIKSLLTNNAVLIELENNKVFKELIERASFDFSLFEIARHIYLLFNENHDLPNCETIKQITFNALWNSLLKAENNEQRISISDLLLTFNDNRKLPDCIYNYVQTCLDFLLNNPISQNINNSTIYNECRNAALFINECIETSSKFVSLEHFGLKSHRFIVPESIINVSIEADGEKYEISVNQNANVAYLITVISSKLNRDVTSIILYSKGKSVPVQTKLASTDLNFEVRFRAEYDRVPPFTLENHPISLLTNEKYMNHLLELLNSPIGEDIYNILIQIPTPKQFKATDLDPSNSYLFLYTLHYYAQHIDELPNKNEQQKNFEDIICQKFDIIVPEARYLLVLLLDKETKNDLLVTKVLYTLCIEKNPQYFTRIMRKLWEIVSNYEISLDPKILSPIIFKDNAKFRELALKSHLIKSQEFDKVWKIFLSNEEKLNHLKVFTMFEIPPNRYQEVFDTLLPFFDSLDESILAIFANLSEKWSNFPADKIANVLITSYIKCTTKPQSISSNPFKLIMSIIQNNEKMREYILSALNQTIPETTEWNYTPTDSFKCNEKCGLNNLGATCYVNSVLQQIFNIEPLRNFIISNDEFIDPSMQALHKLFTQMMYSQRKFIDMNIFATQWTGWDGACINPREQQDANEFLMCLFSRLEMYPEIYSLINGETETRFVGEGKTISTQKTSFNTLPLIVLGQNSIKDSMKIAAIPEIIENYKVDDNSKPITVESTNKIITLPPYLFFQLKRFDYSIETQTRVKIDQKYEYEDEIDLKEFVEFSGETKYRIIGVILHQGEVDVGHYFSYTKINENQWRCLNDTGVTIVSDNVMKNETYGNPEGSSAYILVYERIDVHSPPDTASNDASGSIVSSISSQIPLSPNPELVDEVQKDNLRLIVDSVYFTEYFADFIFQLMNTTNNNEEVDSIALKYSMSSLVHSSLADSYSKFVSSFSQKFHESENFMNIFRTI
ncbi:hypothetical protein TRFO_18794 [Tritrichomonas foetus]|uniref:USP domain-containing protein n=1 Tax=Tritrichomonas foetus TaxID=1144522 RepID=A0A1J4KKG6_9EUKA|nr:hypothetical protein TRFO_18794 [Tritrichomonas foetus]|eukprot:OHT11723.1 hypothetical protein TRFO_18794 [Tritrichomonas foetus]